MTSSKKVPAPTKGPAKPKAAGSAAAATAAREEGVTAPPLKTRSRKKPAESLISACERHHLIEVAAYYIAERRGFQIGTAHDDWLEAEREIDGLMAAGHFSG